MGRGVLESGFVVCLTLYYAKNIFSSTPEDRIPEKHADAPGGLGREQRRRRLPRQLHA